MRILTTGRMNIPADIDRPNQEAPSHSNDPFKPYRCGPCGLQYVNWELARDCCAGLCELKKAPEPEFVRSKYRGLTDNQRDKLFELFSQGIGATEAANLLKINYQSVRQPFGYFRNYTMNITHMTTKAEWGSWRMIRRKANGHKP